MKTAYRIYQVVLFWGVFAAWAATIFTDFAPSNEVVASVAFLALMLALDLDRRSARNDRD